MAVVKTPQESRIGIKVANGTSASGAAQFKTLRFSNVKLTILPPALRNGIFSVLVIGLSSFR